MFGIGVQEMVIIGLLFLIIFGPSKLPRMARDFGRFVNEARRTVDGFKEDFLEVENGRKPEKSRGFDGEEAAEIDWSGRRIE